MRDEFERIDWLKGRFELDGDSEGVVLGIGDDAAVFDFAGRPAIVTVDTQVEGVHFRHDLISCRDVGRKAMIATVSDVWAMGGMPTASVVAITLSDEMPDQAFRELVDGLAGAARTTGARIIGGNLSAGPILSITTTAFGLPLQRPVRRDGAKPGDGIYITGTLGTAALGFALLENGRTDLEGAGRFVERWRRPPIRGRIAKSLADIATAAVDVSDGCLQDLQHICDASSVGATIEADALPTAEGHDRLSAALDLDPLALALGGGEDYELLFTAASATEAEAVATKIGVVTDGDTAQALDSDRRRVGVNHGFRHFS